MYGNIYDDEERFERQADFPKLLAKHAEDFSWVYNTVTLHDTVLTVI